MVQVIWSKEYTDSWKTHAFLQSHDSGPIKFLATNVSLQYTAESFLF